MFITPASLSKGWTWSEKTVESTESFLAMTLQQLYKNESNKLWLLYNDQPPNAEWRKYGGHTKGVVGGDELGGFWLVHSVPHFPPVPSEEGYSYPKTGLKNGQSFLCISFKSKDLDSVGTQLGINEIYPYWKDLPDALRGKYPNLVNASRGVKVKEAPFQRVVALKSSDGKVFKSFAKATKFRKDLYEDFVAPTLKTDLLVESWLNGPNILTSNCSEQFSINNINKVQLCKPDLCTAFSSRKDHSKWAVSPSKQSPWTCVGDINRAKSQEGRGGGTVCIKNNQIWNAYNKAVVDIEPCKRTKYEPEVKKVIAI